MNNHFGSEQNVRSLNREIDPVRSNTIIDFECTIRLEQNFFD